MTIKTDSVVRATINLTGLEIEALRIFAGGAENIDLESMFQGVISHHADDFISILKAMFIKLYNELPPL